MELAVEMPSQRILAHPFVGQLQWCVALRRDPLIYYGEGVDNQGSTDSVLASAPPLRDEYQSSILGGVVTIVGQNPDGGQLRAVPY
jgi:DUF1680 family protein